MPDMTVTHAPLALTVAAQIHELLHNSSLSENEQFAAVNIVQESFVRGWINTAQLTYEVEGISKTIQSRRTHDIVAQ